MAPLIGTCPGNLSEEEACDCETCQLRRNAICDSVTEEINLFVNFRKCGHSWRNGFFEDEVSSDLRICPQKSLKKVDCGHWKEVSCPEEINGSDLELKCNRCNRKIKEIKFTYCKHEIKLGCCDSGSDPVLCRIFSKRTYPCGHTKVLADYEELGTCDVICEEELPCGHFCGELCHANEPHPICKELCFKKCPKGHWCSERGNHFCGVPCPPCTEYISDEEILCSTCEHPLKKWCKDDYKVEVCPQPCEKNCAKGHPCTRTCGEECLCEVMVEKTNPWCSHVDWVPCHVKLQLNSPCREQVSPDLNPECGHVINVPCRQRNAGLPQLLALCSVPCTDYLGCEHVCSGNCWDCSQGRLHVRCTAPCGRPLLCGHICSSPCSSDCPPCEAPCQRSCKHRVCNRKCGVPCLNCEEDCGAQCDCGIYKCSKKCYEPCDPGFCENPCFRLLRCGHECIGYCGETCPKLCRICDKEKVEEGIFTGEELNENHRFIQMDNCEHVIDRESLDGYMASRSEDDEIAPIGCPLCRQTMQNIKRYSVILKMNRRDTDRVFINIYGSDEENKENLDTLKGLLSVDQDNENLNYPEFYNYLVGKLVGSQTFDKPQIKTYKAFYGLWHRCEETYNRLAPLVNEYIREDLNSKCKEFLELLMKRSVPLTTSERVDLNRETLRLNDFIDLLQRIREDLPPETQILINNQAAKLAYRRAKNRLFNPERYSGDVETSFRQHLQILDVETHSQIKVDLTERRQIAEAFRVREYLRGRWHKCRNGHPYIVTECGGAMQISKCNECDALIGGQDHHLLPGNSTSIEMAEAAGGDYPPHLSLRQVPDEFEPAPRVDPPALLFDI